VRVHGHDHASQLAVGHGGWADVIHQGDCLSILREQFADESVQCCVKYWTSDAIRLDQAADRGLCQFTKLDYPWWQWDTVDGPTG